MVANYKIRTKDILPWHDIHTIFNESHPSGSKARFEVFTSVKILVEVFWVVMLCSVVDGGSKVL
jgi:hypothetical protein